MHERPVARDGPRDAHVHSRPACTYTKRALLEREPCGVNVPVVSVREWVFRTSRNKHRHAPPQPNTGFVGVRVKVWKSWRKLRLVAVWTVHFLSKQSERLARIKLNRSKSDPEREVFFATAPFASLQTKQTLC